MCFFDCPGLIVCGGTIGLCSDNGNSLRGPLVPDMAEMSIDGMKKSGRNSDHAIHHVMSVVRGIIECGAVDMCITGCHFVYVIDGGKLFVGCGISVTSPPGDNSSKSGSPRTITAGRRPSLPYPSRSLTLRRHCHIPCGQNRSTDSPNSYRHHDRSSCSAEHQLFFLQ